MFSRYFLLNILVIIGGFELRPVYGGCRSLPRSDCEKICDMDPYQYPNANCTIRAVVLIPSSDFYDFSLKKVVPFLKIAENRAKDLQIIPRNIKFSWIPQDDRCDASYALIEAMDAITRNCSHVMFGPVCDYPLASVGRIAKYFHAEGTPIISVGGFTFDFQQKKTTCQDEFYMLIRTGLVSFQSLSELILTIMNKYNWRRALVLYERDGQKNVGGIHTCQLMMKTIANTLNKNTEITFSPFDLDSGTKNLTVDLTREIGNRNSIIIMCADPESIRKIMLVAEELNMVDSGDYVFINIELFSRVPQGSAQPWYNKNDTKENNERAKKAFTALLTVSPKQPDDEEYLRFSNEIKDIATQKYNYTFNPDESLSTFVTSFYDAVLLYATALNDSIREDPTTLTKPINGTDIVRRMWNRTFQGITGNIKIDNNGDRVTTYSLLDMNPINGKFEIVANFLQNRLEYVDGKSIQWAGGRLEAPSDQPICGFDGSLCPSLPGYAILSLVLGFIVVGMAIGSIFGYRHFKSEAEINSMTWRVKYEDVIPCDINERHLGAGGGSMHSLAGKRNMGGGSQLTLYSDEMVSLAGDRQLYIPLAIYKGSKVAIKRIDESNIVLNRSLMLELKRMKDIQNDHFVKFFGACIDPPKCFLLTEYCPKGSLEDILANEQITLDWMFKLSLMHDIVKGMNFLHCSEIKSHGNLKSSNCVVDSRFVLKICDFGLHQLRRSNYEDDEEKYNSYAYWKKLLWTAPELLRAEKRLPEGTPKGDIYSFGIIIHEIITRQGPFYLGPEEKSPQEIIELVKGYGQCLIPESIVAAAGVTPAPFRPFMDHENYIDCDNMNEIMVKCWAEDPFERPDFCYLKSTIRKINKKNETGNIVDNLLKRMEQYANNLEGLVDERTKKYLEEKRKYEELLYKLLPQSVAAQLISKQVVMAESFDQVTIYFSDIVGFTAISAESTPMEIVEFLNDLYTKFDKIVELFDVYKVETIGDAYMVVSGLPIPNGNLHAVEIARLALALLEAVNEFEIHHRPNDKLKLRIGLHSGPCVAGVVGKKMPRYCLFGDTVNTASRMESNGEALKIHISHTTKTYLDQFGTFIMKERGLVPMKGKGEMLTYWLEGEIKIPPTYNTTINYNSNNQHPNQHPYQHHHHNIINERTNSFNRSFQRIHDISNSQTSIQNHHYHHHHNHNNNINNNNNINKSDCNNLLNQISPIQSPNINHHSYNNLQLQQLQQPPLQAHEHSINFHQQFSHNNNNLNRSNSSNSKLITSPTTSTPSTPTPTTTISNNKHFKTEQKIDMTTLVDTTQQPRTAITVQNNQNVGNETTTTPRTPPTNEDHQNDPKCENLMKNIIDDDTDLLIKTNNLPNKINRIHCSHNLNNSDNFSNNSNKIINIDDAAAAAHQLSSDIIPATAVLDHNIDEDDDDNINNPDDNCHESHNLMQKQNNIICNSNSNNCSSSSSSSNPPPNTIVNFNNIVKTNNMKNYQILCNSTNNSTNNTNNDDNNVNKSVTQPLLTKINS